MNGTATIQPDICDTAQKGVFETLLAAYEAERRGEEPEEHERYLLALLTPDHLEKLHRLPARKDGGLVLHCDGVWQENVAWISDAETSVGEDCGYHVEAVEHRDGDLWYWTFAPAADE